MRLLRETSLTQARNPELVYGLGLRSPKPGVLMSLLGVCALAAASMLKGSCKHAVSGVYMLHLGKLSSKVFRVTSRLRAYSWADRGWGLGL